MFVIGQAWVRGEVDAKFFGDIAEGCCRLDLVSGYTDIKFYKYVGKKLQKN